MSRAPAGEAERVHLADRPAWRAWLAAHADSSPGIWLVYDKGAGRRLSAADITEEALCFGWVDSLPRRLDDTRAMIYVAPRRPSSNWSRVNKERVERLTAEGLMTPRGLAVVAQARADGRWQGLDEVEDLTEPGDLCRALDAVPAARREWDAFPRSAKRAILEWVAAAQRPETRARRVATVVDDAAVGRRANQWRQPGR
jgi:uncharacterized protein YdeI (YjbR/CyaY-like superfamily)